ncbi:MAG: polyisoprenoid-binding protein [Thermodesulfobacteriota bacterium]|nr:MAG: polyisoprenoid-binding protein [Thermodesulfobacteriota bacterium]
MNFVKSTLSVAVIAFSFFALSFSPSQAEVAEYAIDPDHSAVIFKVKHLAISTVTGRFDLFEGSYKFDTENIANSSVDTTIVASSINTNEKDRDDHLKSDDFLDVEKYPNITFKSKEIKKVDGSDFQIVGDLTIHGVTKEVILDAVYEGSAKDPRGNERTGFVANGKINRKDFGMTWNKALELGGVVVGEEVRITLEVQGIRNKS